MKRINTLNVRFTGGTPVVLRTGFTLLELLIAIGILAVGGAMAAALFPAAIKENQRANSSVIGRIICENGLCNVKIALVHDAVTPSYPFSSTELVESATAVGLRNLAYPTPRQEQPTAPFTAADYPDWKDLGSSVNPRVVPQTLFGNLLLGKQAISGANDYQLVLIAYRRRAADDSNVDNGIPALRQVTFSSDAGSYSFTVSGTNDADYLRLGSPLIHAETGRFATIVSRNGSAGTLDKPIAITDISSKSGWVVYDPNDPIKSPSQRVLISRTPLSTP